MHIKPTNTKVTKKNKNNSFYIIILIIYEFKQQNIFKFI